MKILRIRLKNLNSLVGEWSIDLNDPDFVRDGIFAITGPTGSGKSTILDAICLALYGRTPRLDKINKESNDIMSKHCADCLAEVEFSTQKGRYRCTWGHYRARKKATGALQAISHEIVDLASNKPMMSKKSEVAEIVTEVTGLNYDRFTRSMLLAQGNFAIFLQAKPKDRSPILEGITGTDIYSQISERVHKRWAIEDSALKALQAETKNVIVLGAEEKERLVQQQGELERQVSEMTTEAERLAEAIAWHQRLAEDKDGLAKLQAEKEQHEQSTKAFAPEGRRLDAALRALECGAAHSDFSQARKALTEKTATHCEVKTAMPAVENNAARAQEAASTAEKKRLDAKGEQSRLLPIIKDARGLDGAIIGKKDVLDQAENRHRAAAGRLQELQKKHTETATALQETQKALVARQAEQASAMADAELVGQLSALTGHFDQLREARQQLDALCRDSAALQKRVESATSHFATQERLVTERQQAEANAREMLQSAQVDLQELLGDRELTDWQDRQSELLLQQGQLDDASRKQSDHSAALLKQAELTALLQRHRERQRRLEKEIADQREHCADAQKIERALGEKLELQRLILSFEEARKQLADGKPCPLCGALAHPWAAGNIPKPDDSKAELDRARADMQKKNDDLQALRLDLAHCTKDIGQTEAAVTLFDKALPEITQHLAECLTALPGENTLAPTTPDLAAQLSARKQVLEEEKVQTAKVINDAKKKAKARDDLKKSAEVAKEAGATAETVRLQAKSDLTNAEQLNLHKEESVASARLRHTSCLETARRALQPYGVSELREDGLEALAAKLTRRRDVWLTRQNIIDELKRLIPVQESSCAHLAETITQTDNEAKLRQKECDGLRRELDELRSQRAELLGGKSADEEDNRLVKALDDAETALAAATRGLQDATKALDSQKTTLATLQTDIDRLTAEKDRAEAAFLTALGAQGFADTAAFLAAQLPEAARRDLSEKQQALQTKTAELSSREKDLSTRLAAEEAKALSSESLSNLEDTRVILRSKQAECQTALGVISQQFASDKEARLRLQDKVDASERQEAICRRWNALHDLIGSSDGKKFRDFAQGLTFEIMVKKANAQLYKMTDRYLLVRDENAPLELNVIDNHQGGERRTTKNLSGGESFIVSLALALGLASMASKNVRLDSLFLDEGFGALDDNALTTALDALAELRQDGKLIGVISHVAAIKERIPTQIQLLRTTRGRSRLSGPGCMEIPLKKKDA